LRRAGWNERAAKQLKGAATASQALGLASTSFEMRRKVHIVYSSEDENLASSIRQYLQAGGMKCSGSGSGDAQGRKAATARAVRRSDLVVLVLSAAADGSAQVRWEVEEAAKADKPIVPFRTDFAPLSKSFEFYLSTAQWLDATSPPLEPHLEQLVTTARRLVGLEKGDVRSSVFRRGRRPSKKAVAAAVFGVLSIIAAAAILGSLGILLGALELRAITRGTSSAAGRRYARVGIVCGLIGIVLGAAVGVLMWYYDVDPFEGWGEIFGASLPATPTRG